MKKILKGLLGLLILVVLVIALKTILYPFGEVKEYKEKVFAMPQGFEKNIARFADGIKIPTVSTPNYEETDFEPFKQFSKFIEESYPIVFANTQHYTVNEYGLVFKWKGSKESLNPILFNAHYDVVPAGDEEELTNLQIPFDIAIDDTYLPTENPLKWTYPAFSGAVHQGRIYGRGTIDMKGMAFSLLDSAERLMQEGFTPERDIYFVFGQDEEVGSAEGAVKVAEHFKEKGLFFDAVYDEGGIVALASMNQKDYGVAFIGVAEKGFLTLRINVKGEGGHSSMPPKNGSMGDAGIILSLLQKNQIDAIMLPQTKNILKSLGDVMGYKAKILIANQWLFENLLINQLSKSPVANALLRTTTALTQAKGSDAQNILPPVTQIVANFRILPGNTSDEVIKHVEKLCDGFDVSIDVLSKREASNVSPEDTRALDVVKEAIAHTYPSANISTYITIGGTDSRNYQIVGKNIYKFMPIALNTVEQRSIHNYDESLSINNYIRMVEYFSYIMKNYDGKK